MKPTLSGRGVTRDQLGKRRLAGLVRRGGRAAGGGRGLRRIGALISAALVASGVVVLAGAPAAVAAGTAADLQAAIDNAPNGAATSIPLDNSISLDPGTTLTIPAGKVITLTGAFPLIGAPAQPTITVADGGELTLDGITVTHAALTVTGGGINPPSFPASGQPTGTGVQVDAGGALTLASGTIANNRGNPSASGLAGQRGLGVSNFGAFTMSGGSITGNAGERNAPGGGVANQGASATFAMTGGLISNNRAGSLPGWGNNVVGNGGGVANLDGATMTMSGGQISAHVVGGGAPDWASICGTVAICGGGVGGGIFNGASGWNSGAPGTSTCAGSQLTISGTALISGNSTYGVGGGIFSDCGASFIMSGGTVDGNWTFSGNGSGAGIFLSSAGGLQPPTQAEITGGTISNNINNRQNPNINGGNGAGVLADTNVKLTISDTLITGNTAGSGGGVYAVIGGGSTGELRIIRSTISNNTAVGGGNGGGVCAITYPNLFIDADTVFEGNRATVARLRPVGLDATYFANIHATQWSAGLDQGFNNYDVCVTGTRWRWEVLYNGNGNTSGAAPVDATLYEPYTRTVTVLGEADLARTGYTFIGWSRDQNAQPGDSGIYAAPDTFVLGNNEGTAPLPGPIPPAANGKLTLYAVWQADSVPHTVTFDSNGGAGSVPPQTADRPTALTLNGFAREGYAFVGWNTEADGSGTAYADGALYPFDADVTLYAQWRAAGGVEETAPPAPQPGGPNDGNGPSPGAGDNLADTGAPLIAPALGAAALALLAGAALSTLTARRRRGA